MMSSLMTEWIYGRHSVVSVLAAGKRRCIKLYLLSEGDESLRELCRQKRVPVQEVPATFFQKRVPEPVVHQGVLLECEGYSYVPFSQLIEGAPEVDTLLLLDEIQDPQNLGGLIRSAYLLGVRGVVLTVGHGAQVAEGCLKASTGATEWISIARVTSLAKAIEEIKERGYWVYGTAADAGTQVGDEVFPPRVALVIGGEQKGLKRLVKERCDVLLKIPIKTDAFIDSLNASVAGGIFLFEILRQRGKKKSHSP